MFSCAKHTRNWAIFRQGVQVEEMYNAQFRMQKEKWMKIFLRFPELVAEESAECYDIHNIPINGGAL